MPNRMAVLPYQRHPQLVVEGDHADGAGMADVLRARSTPVGGGDLVLDELGDVAGGEHRGGGHRPGFGQIEQLVWADDDHQCWLSTGSRVASWRSSAASISPTNNGCGLVGPGLELGVRLGGDEVRVHVARQLDELDQLRRPARCRLITSPASSQPFAVGVVHLVAVPVPLGDLGLAVALGDQPIRAAAPPG